MSSARPFSVPGIAIAAALINALINAPIGWVMIPAQGSLPLLGVPSIAGDFVATAFGVSFGTALIVTPQMRGQLARGKLLQPEVSPRLAAAFARWPSSTLRRAFNLGVLSVLLFAPPALLALQLGGVTALDRGAFTLAKGLLAAVQGAIVTPLIALAALPSPKAPA